VSTPPGKALTEDDWTNAATAKDAYVKSKALSESAAWNFVSELPGKICPLSVTCMQ